MRLFECARCPPIPFRAVARRSQNLKFPVRSRSEKGHLGYAPVAAGDGKDQRDAENDDTLAQCERHQSPASTDGPASICAEPFGHFFRIGQRLRRRFPAIRSSKDGKLKG
jgi:hypothetical protein